MGVTFCAVAPEHPLAQHAAKAGQRPLAAFIEECKTGGTTEAELALKRKKGMPTGLRHPPAHRPARCGCLGGQLCAHGLWRRRVMGVPADERDFAFASNTASRSNVVLLVDGEFDHHQWQDWYADKQRGVTINSDLQRPDSTRTPWPCRGRGPGPKAWARRRPPGACATGASAANATGARPSHHPLRRAWRRARARKTCRWCCRRTACPTVQATRCTSTKASTPA